MFLGGFKWLSIVCMTSSSFKFNVSKNVLIDSNSKYIRKLDFVSEICRLLCVAGICNFSIECLKYRVLFSSADAINAFSWLPFRCSSWYFSYGATRCPTKIWLFILAVRNISVTITNTISFRRFVIVGKASRDEKVTMRTKIQKNFIGAVPNLLCGENTRKLSLILCLATLVTTTSSNAFIRCWRIFR